MNNTCTNDFGVVISDDNLFGLSDTIISNIEDSFLGKNLEGTQIITPKLINIDSRQTFPLVWVTSYSGYRQWKVIEQQNSYIVMTNLNDGLTRVFYAFPTKKRRKPHFMGYSSNGTPPDNSHNTGSTGVLELDVYSGLIKLEGIIA